MFINCNIALYFLNDWHKSVKLVGRPTWQATIWNCDRPGRQRTRPKLAGFRHRLYCREVQKKSFLIATISKPDALQMLKIFLIMKVKYTDSTTEWSPISLLNYHLSQFVYIVIYIQITLTSLVIILCTRWVIGSCPITVQNKVFLPVTIHTHKINSISWFTKYIMLWNTKKDYYR